MECVVILRELDFGGFLFLLGFFEFLLGVFQIAEQLLVVCLVFVGCCKLLLGLLFALGNLCLGNDEVFLRILVEVSPPHDVVGPVENLVHEILGETLDSGIVVGDVEGDHEFGEPVVLVQLLHDVVDHVLLQLDFAQFIHRFELHDCC